MSTARTVSSGRLVSSGTNGVNRGGDGSDALMAAVLPHWGTSPPLSSREVGWGARHHCWMASGGVRGSSFPEVFEAAAEDAAAQSEDRVGAGDGPAHAGALEPCRAAVTEPRRCASRWARWGKAAGCGSVSRLAALDGGVVAGRPRVVGKGWRSASRPSAVLAVASLTSRVLAEPVGLLAAAPGDLGRADRHAGPIQPQVHRGRRRRCGLLADGALVTGDFAAERLGAALDLPGLDLHPGQGRQPTRSPWRS